MPLCILFRWLNRQETREARTPSNERYLSFYRMQLFLIQPVNSSTPGTARNQSISGYLKTTSRYDPEKCSPSARVCSHCAYTYSLQIRMYNFPLMDISKTFCYPKYLRDKALVDVRPTEIGQNTISSASQPGRAFT